ncbi:MAG: UvrD-helicase domain-containing protein [Rhodobacteraceae bacterium]|nr:UvrD-helicase domain-containing protein [Paracoccaceae bacterium]
MIDNNMQDILKGLNEAQREAAQQTEGPLLIVAGAGTGKTRTLISRMAFIITNGLARPHEILMVTFTNKAANELKSRINNLIGIEPADLSWVGTFHSMSTKILRRESEHVGLSPNFSILDDKDQLKVIQGILTHNKIDKKEWTPRQLASLINYWKNEAKLPEDLHQSEKETFGGKAFKLYEQYQDELRRSNCADFGDLILHVVKILSNNGDLLNFYQDKLFYIMVDEYQDTNIAQYKWLRLLAQKRKNICCVGDDDQSIYSWRGAKPKIMLDFPKYYPASKICKLEENYRSTFHILNSAVGLIQNNFHRHQKTLRMAEHTEIGAYKVQVHCFNRLGEESRFVAHNIKQLYEKGFAGINYGFNEIAVAARTWSQTAEIEENFMALQIPYRVIGGPKFYDRKEVKDAIAYLKLINNPADGVAFDRTVNTPPRGIGKVTVEKIGQYAASNWLTKIDAARQMVAAELLPKATLNKVNQFLADYEHWSKLLRTNQSWWSRNIDSVFEQIGFRDYLKKFYPDDFKERLDNQTKLADMASRFDTLGEYIEHISLLNEANQPQDTQINKVTLMTLHASKGSEYPVMHLIGWNEGGLPWIRSIEETLKNQPKAGFELAKLILNQPPKTIAHISWFFRLAKAVRAELQDPTVSSIPELDELSDTILSWDPNILPTSLIKETELAKRIVSSDDLEEERRLAHVGITRVMKLCIISYSTTTLYNGSRLANLPPSRFIKELSPEHILLFNNGRLLNRTMGPHTQANSMNSKNSSFTPLKNKVSDNTKTKRPLPTKKGIGEGQRVKHPTFGKGTVVAASNNRLMVKFDNKVEKLLLADYITKL